MNTLTDISERTSQTKGWRKVRLNQICEFQHGGTPSKGTEEYWKGSIPWVSPKDMRSNTLYDSTDHISEEAVERSSTRVIPAGTILVVARSGILAHTLPVAIAGTPLAFNQDIKAITVKDDVEPQFIFWALKNFAPYIIKHGIKTGATVHSLRSGFLESLEINLPSLPEQRRIAAILNEEMFAIDRARAAAEEQLEAAKKLPSAYLSTVFDGNKAGRWNVVKMGDVARVQSGYAFKSDWFTNDGIRLLRNANISPGRIAWDDVVHLPYIRRSEFKAYELSEGDIVLSLDRPIINTGLKIARLSSEDVPSLLLQRVGRFHTNGRVDASYLYAFLNSTTFTDAIIGHDQSLGVPHISPSQVEAIAMPLPSLEEQRTVAVSLNNKIITSMELRRALENQLEMINRLPARLLYQAFCGQTYE